MLQEVDAWGSAFGSSGLARSQRGRTQGRASCTCRRAGGQGQVGSKMSHPCATVTETRLKGGAASDTKGSHHLEVDSLAGLDAQDKLVVVRRGGSRKECVWRLAELNADLRLALVESLSALKDEGDAAPPRARVREQRNGRIEWGLARSRGVRPLSSTHLFTWSTAVAKVGVVESAGTPVSER